MTNYRFFLLGARALLNQCAEELLNRGHQILGIISDDPDVARWAASHNVDVIPNSRADSIVGVEYDYLLSIVNLTVTPANIIESPKIAAINFHDGWLPDYAGLNTPAWALLNRESRHGITWHQMLPQVDRGDIYVQVPIELDDDETAFSLNIKCYEQASAAFSTLLGKIEQGDLNGIAQDHSKMRLFKSTDRPVNGAWLDWQLPADDCAALVRALYFGGQYANAVGSPRVLLNEQVYIVNTAIAEPEDSSATAGTIVSAGADGLRVATGSGTLLLTSISKGVCGEIVAPETFTQGERFTIVGDAEAQPEFQAFIDATGKNERYWVRRLAKIGEYDSPLRVSGATNQRPKYETLAMNPPKLAGAEQLAACAAFWARLAKALTIEFPFILDDLNTHPFKRAGFVRAVPVALDLPDCANSAALADQLTSAMALSQSKSPYSKDLQVRYPELSGVARGWFAEQHTLAFCVQSSTQSIVEALDSGKLPGLLNVVWDTATSQLSWVYDSTQVSADQVEPLQQQFYAFAEALAAGHAPQEATLLTAQDWSQLRERNATQVDYDTHCVHRLIERQAVSNPDAPALACANVLYSYNELNAKANQMARCLQDVGVGIGDRVGVLMDRSEKMVIAMIGAWKAGGSYVPLDPEYPADRIQYMIEDSGLAAIVTDNHKSRFHAPESVAWVEYGTLTEALSTHDTGNLDVPVTPQELAYTIYTSGSTGKPKGVMVEHRNAENFFVGMDARIESDQPGTWLAVTSMSFDISILEMFWSLSRGFKLVVYQDKNKAIAAANKSQSSLDFSLFYWNVATEIQEHEPDKYRLLLEGAKFGDQNGFKAVWTPERHFAAFGALFPNPAVTSAALATMTQNIDIRAGSCVAPLHSAIRIAEDWSVVDNLSNGRVGIAFAAGWAPQDFAIIPENFPNAKQKMFEQMDTVRQLWKGESITFKGGKGDVDVRTLPRPIQKTLPCWVTTAGNIDSFTQAAEKQAGVLTHLLGQSVDEVAEKVAAYRARWKECGHPGEGHVVLMLHTLVGASDEAVEAAAREPMKEYLRSAMFLVKDAAWNFPIYKQMSEEQGKTIDEIFETLSDEDFDQLLDFAFERYYRTSGLFGTPESAMEIVKAAKGAGVNEIGCLIDYGIDADTVLEHLPYLKQLLDKVKATQWDAVVGADSGNDIAAMHEQFSQHEVTHFQCTPSMATMLVNDLSMQPHLASLKQMMVGGEAMPPQLAKQLAEGVSSGRVTNMYGPTETTIWSSTHDLTLESVAKGVSIGKPIANTQIYIVDEQMQLLPNGTVGEIVIAGDGVVRGYHNRPELTEKVFVDYTVDGQTCRAYRTGDLGRWLDDGTLQCLGRKDHQVKIRGYRIELGEVEALLRDHPLVLEAAVDVLPERQQLAAFYTLASNEKPDVKALEAFLAEKLPEFMVPAFFKEMNQIPQTPNGKIDRKALPKKDLGKSGVQSEATFVAPTSDIENQVAEVWKKALGVDSVGINDNFFDIGGHSILALQVLQQLRDITDKSLQMTDLFKYTTISTISAFLSADGDSQEQTPKLKSRADARRSARKGGRNRSRSNR